MGRRHHQFRKRKDESSFASQLIIGCVVVFALIFINAPQMSAFWTGLISTPEENAKREASVYYSGCNEARAAGAAPIYSGQPGYRAEMDGDHDGIACEVRY